MIQQGRLKARKDGGQWRIARDDIPVSARREREQEVDREQVLQIAEEVLKGASKKGKHYSILDLRSFDKGREIYWRLCDAYGKGHASAKLMQSSLEYLGCGCHEFAGGRKAEAFEEARACAAKAAALLMLERENEHELAGSIERDYLTGIGGLMRRIDGKRRR
jgi:hypothetical protein